MQDSTCGCTCRRLSQLHEPFCDTRLMASHKLPPAQYMHTASAADAHRGGGPMHAEGGARAQTLACRSGATEGEGGGALKNEAIGLTQLRHHVLQHVVVCGGTAHAALAAAAHTVQLPLPRACSGLAAQDGVKAEHG